MDSAMRDYFFDIEVSWGNQAVGADLMYESGSAEATRHTYIDTNYTTDFIVWVWEVCVRNLVCNCMYFMF